MSFIGDVFEAARGGIKERDEAISVLEKKLDSMTNSRNYYKGERDTCLELVKQAGEKEKEYNAAIERCAELEAQVAEAEAMARSFASDFDLALPDRPEPDEPSPAPVEGPDHEPVADGGEEA